MTKAKRRSFYGERQSDALKAMRSAQKSGDDGTFFEAKTVSVSSWLDIWLEEYIKPGNKPLTYSTYQSRIETHIKPALGKIRLKALNATHVQAFYNSLLREKELHPKTIKNVHGILHKALDQAVKLRYIGINVSDACTLPRVEKKEVKPLTEEQITQFLDLIQLDTLRDLFTVALFTGMREGEICGLPWSAVNFKNGTITVRQQLCREKERGGKHYIAPTKNDKARTLTAAPFVMDILRRVKREQMGHRLKMDEAWEAEPRTRHGKLYARRLRSRIGENEEGERGTHAVVFRENQSVKFYKG